LRNRFDIAGHIAGAHVVVALVSTGGKVTGLVENDDELKGGSWQWH
jgi:hypothetical protein